MPLETATRALKLVLFVKPGTTDEAIDFADAARLGLLMTKLIYGASIYEAAIAQSVKKFCLSAFWMETRTVDRFVSERDHDLRAALVCLLTAGFAHARTGTSVGDETGGWFWLPPHDLWATWAVEALEANLLHLQDAKHPQVDLFKENDRTGQ